MPKIVLHDFVGKLRPGTTLSSGTPASSKSLTLHLHWYRNLGQRLRHCRTQSGLTQTEVAHELGITYQMLQKYEKGTARLPAHYILPLCHLFQIHPNWLLGTDEKTANPLTR